MKKVSFYGREGRRIAADLYLPPKTFRRAAHPAVVLCQGLSGVKDKVLPGIGQAFAQAGYMALAFDYRGYGESEDARPRPSLFPMERVDDALSALSFMESLPEVDRKRIGLYGISYGGAVASQGKPMLSLESGEAMLRFQPSAFLPFTIPRPVLFLHGAKDDVAPVGQAKAFYRLVRPPKKFVAFEGKDHIDLDCGEGLQRQIRLSLQWFDRFLHPAKRPRS